MFCEGFCLLPSQRLPRPFAPPPYYKPATRPAYRSAYFSAYCPAYSSAYCPYYPPTFLLLCPPNISRLTAFIQPAHILCALSAYFPCLPGAPSIFTFPFSTGFPLNISRRIACLLPAMRLFYSPVYSPAYCPAYLAPPIERALRPPSLGAARPPRGPARHEGVDPPCSPTAIPAKGFWGKGQKEPPYLSSLTYPPYYYFTYYFLTIDNTPFLYTYK